VPRKEKGTLDKETYGGREAEQVNRNEGINRERKVSGHDRGIKDSGWRY